MVRPQALPRSRNLALLKATFAAAAWGGSFIATKIALREISPVTIIWTRFALGVAILGAAVWARRQFALPSARDWAYFALLGFLGIAFHQWLQSTGLVTAQAITTAWIVASIPIFTAILSWLFLREKLGWPGVLGILMAAGGVLVVVTRGDLRSLAAGQFGPPGDLLVLVSAPNWAIFSVLSRYGLKRHPAARMMFFVMGLGWLFLTALFLAGGYAREIPRLQVDGWLGIAFLGIVCSGLAYVFWYDALQALPTTQVGAFVYLEPLVTLAAAGLVLGESITLASLVGGAVILLGVWLVNRKTGI